MSVSVRDAIVSSSHLASSAPELSEVEFGLIIASHAFNRWMVRCMACAGLPELTSLDILVLNHVFHRGRGKKLADICFTLNVEDTHLVNYSLKKLERLGVVQSAKTGKEVWSFQVGTGIVAPPITWDQDGEQYVAVTAGWGGAVPLWGGDVAKKVSYMNQGGSMWVFKLMKD